MTSLIRFVSGPATLTADGRSTTGTLTKRSTSRNAMLAPKVVSTPDALVKDYTKKRWIILGMVNDNNFWSQEF